MVDAKKVDPEIFYLLFFTHLLHLHETHDHLSGLCLIDKGGGNVMNFPEEKVPSVLKEAPENEHCREEG